MSVCSLVRRATCPGFRMEVLILISERADAEVVGILDTAEALGEGVGIVVTSDMGTTLKCVFLGWERGEDVVLT